MSEFYLFQILTCALSNKLRHLTNKKISFFFPHKKLSISAARLLLFFSKMEPVSFRVMTRFLLFRLVGGQRDSFQRTNWQTTKCHLRTHHLSHVSTTVEWWSMKGSGPRVELSIEWLNVCSSVNLISAATVRVNEMWPPQSHYWTENQHTAMTSYAHSHAASWLALHI